MRKIEPLKKKKTQKAESPLPVKHSVKVDDSVFRLKAPTAAEKIANSLQKEISPLSDKNRKREHEAKLARDHEQYLKDLEV
jgi:hypothetical protein